MLRNASYVTTRTAIAMGEKFPMLAAVGLQYHLLQPKRCKSTSLVMSSRSTEEASSHLLHRHFQQSQQRTVVHSSLRHRRPQVNGESVAFHVSDLVNSNFTQSILPSNGATPRQPPARLRSQRSTTKYDSDLIVLLDMDECLIHTQFLSHPSSAEVYANQLQQKARIRRQNMQRNVVDSFRLTLPEVGLIHVNIRPGLYSFLDQVTQRYETHIYTSSMPEYADPVIDQIDPYGTRFAHRWYRNSCTYHHGGYVKNISKLPLGDDVDLDRVVLIDNSPLTFIPNPSNGILISSFFNDPNDNALEAVWQLLQELDSEPSVRPVLEKRFGMEQALNRISLNAKDGTVPLSL